MIKPLRIVFTGGGTGGHVYPNIAIYESLVEKHPQAAVLYIGTKKGAESRIIDNISKPITFKTVFSRGLPNKLASLDTVISLFFIFLGAIQSYFILKRFKPDIVVGSGGYVTAPVLLAASILRIKVFIHEQNAAPGRLNRFIAGFATRIGVTFASTKSFFPEDRVVVTGYPLRRAILLLKDENIKKKYHIPANNKVVFAFGGSSGARTINVAMAELAPKFLAQKDLTIILSTGRGYSREYRAYEDTMGQLKENGIPAEVEGRLIIREYFDNIDEIYSISDLVISRAGAGTIKEITSLGIPAILIPKIDLPGDHQILNAREIEKTGGARIVYEEIFHNEGQRVIHVPENTLFNVVLEIMGNHELMFNMTRSLKSIETHHSSEIIVREIEQILEEKLDIKEKQIRVFYLQSASSEKTIEIIYESTLIGNSFLCDWQIHSRGSEWLLELRKFKEEKILAKRLKGEILLNDQPLTGITELHEEDQLKIGPESFQMKSYFEKVQKIEIEDNGEGKESRSRLGMFVSSFGSLLREIIMALLFGTGKAMDIYAVVMSLNRFLRRLVADVFLKKSFIPIFRSLFNREPRKRTWDLVSAVQNLAILGGCLLILLMVLFPQAIVRTLYPGFYFHEIDLEAVRMIRLMAPYLLLAIMASTCMIYLKVFKSKNISEFSIFIFSLGMLFGIGIFYRTEGMFSLGYGVIAGIFCQLLFLAPFTIRLLRHESFQFGYSLRFFPDSSVMKKLSSRLGFFSTEAFLTKSTDFVDYFLASSQPIGAISWLYFAKGIFRIPVSYLTRNIHQKILKDYALEDILLNKEKTKSWLLDGMKVSIFLFAPLSILVFSLSAQIVSVFLGRGNFTSSSVAQTALALKLFAVGFIGWGVYSFTNRVFSIWIEEKLANWLNGLMLLTHIILAAALLQTRLEYAGIALAASITALLFPIIRFIILKNRLEKIGVSFRYRELLSSVIKTVIASLLMITIIYHAKFLFNLIQIKSRFFHDLMLIISISFVGTAIYFLSSLILRNAEIFTSKNRLFRRSKKVPVSMLSPFKFLELANKNPDLYRHDYYYKINTYLASRNWAVWNIGIKLIGLFKVKNKAPYLIEFLKSDHHNGFMRRNAVVSLKELGIWNGEIKQLLMDVLDDPYYEVRVAGIQYLVKCCHVNDFQFFKEVIFSKLKKGRVEEKLASLKLLAKLGCREDLLTLLPFFLNRSSLLREELLELLYAFYRRKLLDETELKHQINQVLITSNNMEAEFKLKSIIHRIYKEIE